MSDDRENLATYQARLLAALHAASDVAEARSKMTHIAESAGVRNELGEVDDRMLAVAVELTKKWGVLKR